MIPGTWQECLISVYYEAKSHVFIPHLSHECGLICFADAAGPATRKRQLFRGRVRRAGRRLRHHRVLHQGESQGSTD